MPARVQIVVEAKDSSSGVLRAITGQMGALGGLVEELTSKNVNWGNVTERAATMVIDEFKKAIQVTQEYAEAVRDQMLLSGQSAEASSRFLQVLDDYQLSADDAKLATRALTKEGLAPTVDTLIQLSTEYNKLATAEERNAFVQKNLGRSGQEWLNLLNQGPDAIRAMNDAVSESLILNEEEIQSMEEYRLAVDQLNDAWMGVQVTVGTAVIPMMTNLLNTIEDDTAAIKDHNSVTELLGIYYKYLSVPLGGLPLLFRKQKEAQDEVTESGKNLNQTIDDTKEQEKELAQVADNLKAALSGDLLQAYENYGDKTQELKDEAADLAKQMRDLAKHGKGNSEAYKELTEKMNENTKAQKDLEASTKKSIAQLIYQQAAASLDSKGQLELARQLGLVSEQDYNIAVAIDTLTEKYDANQDGIVDSTEATADYIKELMKLNGQLDQLPDVVTTTVITNFVTSGTPTTAPSYDNTPLCFIEDTPVLMSDGKEKAIQDIHEGEEVFSFDTKSKKLVRAVVSKTFSHSPSEMRNGYYLLINDSIGATSEHPFYANGKWIHADQLKVGDELLSSNGSVVAVTRVRMIYRRVWTYNLHIHHETHNYFAGGVLVHNKLQQGGVAYAGQPTLVGEAGPEPFYPSVSGRVLSHAEAIHAQTVGGGGNNMYFYGNVTIASGGENAGDIMEIR